MGKFDDLKQPKPTSSLGKLTLGVTPAPGIPGTRLPPRGAPPPLPPRIAPDAETPLPPVQARPRRATETGLAPPAPGSAPVPPPRPPYKQNVSPPPFASPAEEEAIRREAARRGDHVINHPPSIPPRAPVASSVPPSARQEPPWWRTSLGMIKVVGALSVAIPATVTGTTAAVVSVINALRQPTDPKLREDVEGTRKELAALRTYLADKDTARALEIEKMKDSFNAKYQELDLRYPPLKLDPLRAPK